MKLTSPRTPQGPFLASPWNENAPASFDFASAKSMYTGMFLVPLMARLPLVVATQKYSGATSTSHLSVWANARAGVPNTPQTAIASAHTRARCLTEIRRIVTIALPDRFVTVPSRAPRSMSRPVVRPIRVHRGARSACTRSRPPRCWRSSKLMSGGVTDRSMTASRRRYRPIGHARRDPPASPTGRKSSTSPGRSRPEKSRIPRSRLWRWRAP